MSFSGLHFQIVESYRCENFVKIIPRRTQNWTTKLLVTFENLSVGECSSFRKEVMSLDNSGHSLFLSYFHPENILILMNKSRQSTYHR